MLRLTATTLLLLLVFHIAFAQKAKIVKFDKLNSIISTQSDQIQVINFWATWCAPCVKELPLFETLEAKNDATVKITLINLDYADKISKVNAFLAKKKITSEVLLLDEIDYNSWIDKVDGGWGGAIPATLLLNTRTGQRKFVDKELKEGELESYIQSLK